MFFWTWREAAALCKSFYCNDWEVSEFGRDDAIKRFAS